MEISVFAKEPIKCMHLAIFGGDFELLFWQTDLTSVFLWVAFWTAPCIQNILCYSTVHLRAAFIDFTLLLNSSPIYNPTIKTAGHIPSTLPEVRGCYSGGDPKRDVQDYTLITTMEAGLAACSSAHPSIWTWISNMQQLHLRLAGWVNIYTHDCKHSQTSKCRWYLHGVGTVSQNTDSV